MTSGLSSSVSAVLQNNAESLEFHAQDATMLEDVFVNKRNFKKEQIRVIAGKDATTSNIRSALGDKRTRAKADDLVLIYISSHGVPRNLSPTGLS
jgi:Caspase domain